MPADAITTTVSTKGQVILPKAVRDHLRWGPGTRLVLQETNGGVMLRAAAMHFAPTKPDQVFGALKRHGAPVSVEDMHAGIVAEAKRRHARGRY